MYQHLQYARCNSNVMSKQILGVAIYTSFNNLWKQYRAWERRMQAPRSIKDVSIATEHVTRKVACWVSTVRELSREKMQNYCTHVDFENAIAWINLRGLLTQTLQQWSYYSSNFFSNNTILLPWESNYLWVISSLKSKFVLFNFNSPVGDCIID